MRHAGEAALSALAPLLEEVRKRPQLRERRHGIFYQGGRARLHFHEDASGLYADLRTGAEWLRFDVTGQTGRDDLLRRLDQPVDPAAAR